MPLFAQRQSPSTDQFPNWFAVYVCDVLRATGEISDGLVRVNAKVLVKRCENLAKAHGTFDSLAAEAISRADDLTGSHPATCEQRA